MDVVVALHAAAALLLLIAGLAKIARPAPTTELLVSLGIPAREPLARVIGVAESGVGIAALGIGGPLTAAATGAFYVGFVVVVVRALGAGATSCGCFGRADAPPSWIHVLGNVVLAAVSFVAIGGDSAIEVMDDQPAGGIGFVLLVGVLAGLALVAFTALPEALGARRSGATTPAFRIDGAGDEKESP
jgi:Methylamine utilisation protein MauE